MSAASIVVTSNSVSVTSKSVTKQDTKTQNDKQDKDSKETEDKNQSLKLLLKKYNIKLSNELTIQKDKKSTSETYATFINEWNETVFAKEIISYFLIKKGEIQNRRVIFLLASPNSKPLSCVLLFEEMIENNIDELEMELDLSKEKTEAERIEYVEEILKKDKLRRKFKDLYKKIEVVLFGDRNFTDEFNKAFKYAFSPENHTEKFQPLPPNISTEDYQAELIGYIVGFLKFGKLSVRSYFSEILKAIGGTEEPKAVYMNRMLFKAIKLHELNQLLTKEKQGLKTSIHYFDIQSETTQVDIENIIDFIAHSELPKQINVDRLLNWIEMFQQSETANLAKHYTHTIHDFLNKAKDPILGPMGYKQIFQSYHLLIDSKQLNLEIEQQLNTDGKKRSVSHEDIIQEETNLKFMIEFLIRQKQLDLIHWIAAEQKPESEKLHTHFKNAITLLRSNNSGEIVPVILRILDKKILNKETPSIPFIIYFLKHRQNLLELKQWLELTFETSEDLTNVQIEKLNLNPEQSSNRIMGWIYSAFSQLRGGSATNAKPNSNNKPDSNAKPNANTNNSAANSAAANSAASHTAASGQTAASKNFKQNH